MKLSKKMHYAKASGLKSTFAIGDGKVIVTSFGKGNEAVLEKEIENGVITNFKNNVEVKLMNKDFNVKRSGTEGRRIITNNPQLAEKIGRDMIDRKDALENRYFGKTFDDNIHIQLIYNIMDIEKILSVHVNNALYALNNVLNRGDDELNDTIGMMYSKAYSTFKSNNKYETFHSNIIKPQMSYFGGAFFETGFDTKAKKNKVERKSEKDIYYIISLLAFIRQATGHGYDLNKDKKEDQTTVALYTLDEKFDKMYNNQSKAFRQEAREVLDSLYDVRIDALNDNFLETATKDLTIIFGIYSAKDRASKIKLARQYYDFLVKKDYKCMGFSIKQLREQIENGHKELQDKKYNTMRKRLNRLIDFVIYIYYTNESAKSEKLVENLRSHNEDDAKNRIYISEAKQLWHAIEKPVRYGILKKLNFRYITSMIPDEFIKATSVEEMRSETWNPIEKNSHYFIKLVYLLTLFLDGKEINDLVTTLINKMENIASFNEVLVAVNREPQYKDEYSVFVDSNIMAQELRALNSFARMEKPSASAKRIMFVEAAKMLGDGGTEEELANYFDGILTGERTKAQKGFRNFIINNVIDSMRFKYLVRYCNVEDVIAFSKNKSLINFVLKEVPQAQILRYYNSCTGSDEREYSDKMVPKLAEIIENMSFEQFKDVKQNAAKESPEEVDKKKKQNVIRLYFTICYIFFKNLIYVNSRYFLAFYCLERDLRLWEENGALGYDDSKVTYTMLTKKFLDMGKVRKTAKESKKQNGEDTSHIPYNYLMANLENADNFAIHSFRNITEHINTVQSAGKYIADIKKPESYYQIYHYIAQRLLCDRIETAEKTCGKTKQYFALVREHGSYCKDFVKALCVPFGYNLPRFKNLSIDGLFDMHDQRKNSDTSING